MQVDPTSSLCRVVSSFAPKSEPTNIIPFRLGDVEVKVKIQSNKNQIIEYANLKSHSLLESIKNRFDNPKFSKSRNLTNPFEEIGNSIFMNRAGVKIANVDAVLRLTNIQSGYLNRYSDHPLTYAAIAEAPGAFVQYLQYRFNNSKGFGISLADSEITWNYDLIKCDNFTVYNGEDGTGDILNNYDSFSREVLAEHADGVDLVVADGAIDSVGRENKQEQDNMKLIYAELLIILTICKTGGNCMFKVFDTYTKASVHLLLTAALSFEDIYIFKPISSRPANSEKYVVCINRKENIEKYISALVSCVKNGDNIYSIYTTIPKKFDEWVTKSNNFHLQRQITYGKKIIAHMRNTKIRVDLYDLHKCNILWNIPTTPLSDVMYKRRDISSRLSKKYYTDDIEPIFVKGTHKHKGFVLIQEGIIDGGTIMRGLMPYISSINNNTILAWFMSDDTDIVSLSLCAKLNKKKVVIFVGYSNTSGELVKISRSYGAEVKVIHGVSENTAPSLDTVKKGALSYYKGNSNVHMINKSLGDIRFISKSYSESLNDVIRFVPGRIWISSGNSMYHNIAKQFRNVKIIRVTTRHNPRASKEKNVETRGSKTKQNYETRVIPPYSSNLMSDGKIWELFLKYGKDGDYIWNSYSPKPLNVGVNDAPTLSFEPIELKISDFGSTKSIGAMKYKVPILSFPGV
ncbi:MAG: hypothetical protein COA94_03535 [Rickettsiales bacterium]|nr:MAG: hypothetical protein COA94_03535 [Rickettsiales bacterium]